MLSILSLLLVLSLSLLITRIATVALTYTGMSREMARFQARSAFTGTGFTTSESEKILTHPVRRRIILLLMLFGNAGIAAVLTSLIVTFVGQESDLSLIVKLVLLISGVIALWVIASSRWVDRQLSKVIEYALSRYTRLEVRDYTSLLHLAGEYKVSELHVDAGDWLANRALQELKLPDEGLLVLGVERTDGDFIGVPNGGDEVHLEEVTKTERVREAEKRLDQDPEN